MATGGIFEVGTAFGRKTSIARDRLEPADLRLRRFAADDVVLIALGFDGIELAREVRASNPDCGLIVLLPSDRGDQRALALDSGADDCIPAPADDGEIRARVASLRRRRGQAKARRLEAFGVELDPLRGEAWRDGRALDLSKTEAKLLEVFLRNPRQTLPRSTLIERVWGPNESSDPEGLLAVYVSYLRRKLELHGGERLVQTVRGVGYAFRLPTRSNDGG